MDVIGAGPITGGSTPSNWVIVSEPLFHAQDLQYRSSTTSVGLAHEHNN